MAFPALSTGIYGYPKEEAAEVALQTVKDNVGNLKYIEFVLHPDPMFEAFGEVADRILEVIPNTGPQISEPPEQEPTASGSQKRTASLHPSSQVAQPTASGSQSGKCEACLWPVR